MIAVMLAGGALLVLHGSTFPPNGAGGDEAFRIAAVMRYSETMVPVDFAYRGLPAFYPPLYFLLLGRVSAWSGLPPQEALKLGVIAAAVLVPLCTFVLWRKLTRDAVLAVAVVAAGIAFHDWYEPYAWIATAVFVPWWLRYVLQVGEDGDPLSPREILIGSVIGGALVTTYYYPFTVGAVQLLALVIVAAATGRRRCTPRIAIRRSAWYVLGGSALVSMPYWLPLLARYATTSGATSLPNRYFAEWMIAPPLPFLTFDVEGIVMLGGLASLVVGARRSKLSFALLTLLGAAYLWFTLGYVAVIVDHPLLAFRTVKVIEVVLVTGAGLGAVRAWRWAAGRSTETSPTARDPRLLATLTVGLVVVVLCTSAVAAMPYLEEQRAAAVPTAALREFEQATSGRHRGQVVLTDRAELLQHEPIFLFNVWNAHYSHPASLFAERARFVQRLAREPDPVVVAAAMRHNRYDRIDSVVFDRAAAGLLYRYFDDNFPNGTVARTLVFSPAQFSSKYFCPTTGAQLQIFVVCAGIHIDDLSPDQQRRLLRHFEGDLAEGSDRGAGHTSALPTG